MNAKLMQLEVISQTTNETRPTPILFVHGAWDGAWCWENFLPYFAQRGYAAHALSLRGHGASEGRDKLRWYSAAHDYVADVAQIVQTLPRPPILVGHSMGGYIVQKYLETATAPAGVLLASVPVSGAFGFALRGAVRHPWPFLKSQLLLDTWHFIATPALAQEAFFSPQMSSQDISRHFARKQSESFRAILDMLFLDLPRPAKVNKIPLLVLGAENDRVFTVKEQQATAQAYGTKAEIFPNMAHDMMLESDWQQVADRILSWLQQQGL